MTRDKPRIATTRQEALSWGHKYYFDLHFCRPCDINGSPYQRKRYASSGECLACRTRRRLVIGEDASAIEHRRATDRDRQARYRARRKAEAIAKGAPTRPRGRPKKGKSVLERVLRDKLQGKSD